MNNFPLFTILILVLPFYITAFPLPVDHINRDFEQELNNWSYVEYKFEAIENSSSNTMDKMTSNVSSSSHRQKNNLTLLMTFTVVACFCMLINIRAFYIVFITSKRKSRPANILVAHLSFVIIVFTFLSCAYILEKIGVVNLSAPGLCKVVTYFRKVFYNVLSMNTVAIIWVRVRNDAVILRKSVAYRVIGVTWAITLISNIPAILMAEYVSSSQTKMGECKEMNLFDSIAATIAYDVLRLVLFNVLVALYLIRAAIKIRSVVRYLQKYKLTHSDAMLGRTKQARLVYFQTILFIVNWLPLGFAVLLYRMFNRSGWNDTYINYLTPLVFLYSNVIIFSPLSYVYLVENMSIMEIIAPCFNAKGRCNLPANLATSVPEKLAVRLNPQLKPRDNIERQNTSATLPTGSNVINKIPDRNFLTSEMSRFSTAGFTEFSGSETNSMANMRPLSLSYFAQGSSTAAGRTRTTKFSVQNVTVQLHSEPNPTNNEDEIVPHKRNCETYV